MMVRDFILLRDSELAAIQAYVAEAATKWSARWLPEGMAARAGPCLRDVPGTVPRVLRELQGQPVGSAYADLDLRSSGGVVQALLGFQDPSSGDAGSRYEQWVESVAQDAIADFWGMLLAGSATDGSPRNLRFVTKDLAHWPAALRAPGAGSMGFALEVGSVSVPFAIDGPLTMRLLALMGRGRGSAPKRGALSSVIATVRNERLWLQARTRSLTIPYEELCALEVGDVLEFEHPVHEPLDVQTGDGAVVGRAWVGRSGNARVLRVSSPPK